jgi:hypothetical protein
MKHAQPIIVLFLTCAGCSHKSAPVSSSVADGPNKAAINAAIRRKTPVLDRTLSATDLNSLKQFMDNYRATSGKYPANKAELKQAFGNEGQALFQLIEDGVLVMTWNTGDEGILAYDKRATESDGMVLTASGIQRMGADDLKRALR